MMKRKAVRIWMHATMGIAGEGAKRRRFGSSEKRAPRRTAVFSVLWVAVVAALGSALADEIPQRVFRKPNPADHDLFGNAIAAVGNDKVLVGAWENTAGGASLFSLDGTLLKTFPARSPAFGSAVAAVGSDKVLIGAYGDDTGMENSGAAYLFDISGRLLTTFHPPIRQGGHFGHMTINAVGIDGGGIPSVLKE